MHVERLLHYSSSSLYHVIGMASTEAATRRRPNLALEASRLCQWRIWLWLEQQTHTASRRHVMGVLSYFVLFFLTDILFKSFKSSGCASKAGKPLPWSEDIHISMFFSQLTGRPSRYCQSGAVEEYIIPLLVPFTVEIVTWFIHHYV